MKTIILKQLTIVNFKGIKSLTIDFDSKETSIRGTNGTGKTTVIDAFTWLLFGKDSTDRKDFEIKTLEGSKAIEKIDHEVTGVLSIDNSIVTLKRCFREKWQKRRGAEESEFTGHETLFFVDDVPYQAGQYSDKINSIIDESLFKTLTNPHYFNSLKWESRRQVIINIAGDISDSEIQSIKPEFKDILKVLEGKSYKEFKAMIAAKKKALKDDADKIPARIDEAQRMVPDEPDYNALNLELTGLQTQLKTIDDQIGDLLNKQEDVRKKENERRDSIFKLQSKLKQIEFDIEQAATSGTREKVAQHNALKSEIQGYENNLVKLDSEYRSNELKIESLNKKLEQLRADWHKENDKQIVFDESKFACPTCKREYAPEDVTAQKETMTANFNNDKIEKCGRITKDGSDTSAQIESLKKANSSIHDQIIELTDKKAEAEKQAGELSKQVAEPVNVNYNSNSDHAEIKRKITELEAQTFTAPDDPELKNKKTTLQLRIDEIKKELAIKEQADRSRARVKELETELKDKSQQLANLEKQEFVADDFINTKMILVENRANSMFKYVKFRLFEKLINGGTEPTCITLVDGVPWPDANNAGRINAGLDIINTLSNFYQVSAPIFIDNAESVVTLIDGNFQLIQLIVDGGYTKLSVSLKSKSISKVA